ncbi:MAG: hypothetical protein AMXMBFR61_13070 [Fimbriimonadales bacterium]
MGELLLFAQLLLLLAGWFSFQHWSRKLQEQARSASLAPEIERLERAAERVLSKLAAESERAKRELDARRTSAGNVESLQAEGRSWQDAAVALVQTGLSPKEIAGRTGRPLSEIELVVSAMRRSADTPPTYSERQQEDT